MPFRDEASQGPERLHADALRERFYASIDDGPRCPQALLQRKRLAARLALFSLIDLRRGAMALVGARAL